MATELTSPPKATGWEGQAQQGADQLQWLKKI